MTGDLARAALTYQEVGATATGTLPAGYRHVRREATVGHGPEDFARAREALLSWEMHRRAGLTVESTTGPAAPGVVVVLSLGWGPVRVKIPCRVVYEVDEPTRAGFAYGTLPGHPASGEEAFVVSLERRGDVVMTITAFSRPARWFARWGGPVAQAVQHAVTARYLRALTAAVQDS